MYWTWLSISSQIMSVISRPIWEHWSRRYLSLELDAVTGPSTKWSPLGKDGSACGSLCHYVASKGMFGSLFMWEQMCIDVELPKCRLHRFSRTVILPLLLTVLCLDFFWVLSFLPCSPMPSGTFSSFVPGKRMWMRPGQSDHCFPLESDLI